MGYFDDDKFYQSEAPTQGVSGYFDKPEFQQKPKKSSFVDNLLGAPIEPILNMASGIIAKPASDIAGLAATAMDMLRGTSGAAGFKNEVQDSLTYSPRTDAGKAIVESPYNPINIIGGAIEKVSGVAGNLIRGDSRNPYREALGNAAQEAVPQALSVGGAVMAKSLSKRAAQASDPEVAGARASLRTDTAIADALKEMGQSADDISAAQMQGLRQKVLESLKVGKQVDPAALLRLDDFKSLDIEPTLGWVGRDPIQYAREMNLRGIEGVGDPLMARMTKGGNVLQQRLAKPAEGALDRYTAGDSLINSLSKYDAGVKSGVDDSYKLARGSDGRSAQLDTATFSKLANDALDYEQLGHYLPAPTRAMLNDISSGKVPFNVNTQVQLDSVLSAAQRSSGRGSPEALAIGKIKDALKNTPLADEAALAGSETQALFSAAKGKALNRFKEQDSAPGYKAAIDGTTAPDDFVNRFIINGKTDEVKALSGIFKKSDPEAFQLARAQIGEKLQRAAFGDNLAGDSPFATARYMQAVRQIGVPKLSAFFNASEVDAFLTMGRVGTYMKQAPSGATVNASNTAAAIANLGIPGNSLIKSIASGAYNAVTRRSRVNNALAAKIPSENVPIPGNHLKYLMYADEAGIAEAQHAAGRRRYQE